MSNKPAVEVAKEIATERDSDRVITLGTGVQVRLRPVSTTLIEEVTSRIKDPDIPMWYNKDRERDEPNPNDPAYLRAVEKTARDRGVAVMDALCMFGVELVDGVPADGEWLKKLKFMAKRNMLDLSSYDLDDPFDLEFLYKRFVAVDNDTLTKLGEISTLTGEEISQQEGSFQRSKKR